MAQFTLGLDFGSLSGRAVLLDLASGTVAAVAEAPYKHGFIKGELPASGERLPHGWSLQDPADYLAVLEQIVPQVLRRAAAQPGSIAGIGLDFTAATVLPVQKDGTPLCFLPGFRQEKHAYVKVWQHHAAQAEALAMTRAARQELPGLLERYGGSISAEWLMPKLWQTLKEAPAVYEAMDHYLEAGDWLVWQLTGQLTRGSCAAGYKALWNKQAGYPPASYFTGLDSRLAGVLDKKLAGPVCPSASRAGRLSRQAAARLGLKEGIPVAAAMVDAHVAVPGAGISGAGQMLIIMGTSNCHLVLAEEEASVPGICGVVEDAVVPGYFAYEAGQNCVGDLFDWFIRNLLPAGLKEQARRENVSEHLILRRLARELKPGQSGLLALDWWNGNRSILNDADLSGLILGLTTSSTAAEIYRALLEATAFGTKKIMENFLDHGVGFDSVTACGGIAAKDPFLLQIYADVTGRPIRALQNSQLVATGAALYGAVAAGVLPDLTAASQLVQTGEAVLYQPDTANSLIYDKLYAEYCLLHDLLGKEGPAVMKRLLAIRQESSL